MTASSLTITSYRYGPAWRWRVLDNVGRVIGESGESFPTAEAAEQASYRLRLFLEGPRRVSRDSASKPAEPKKLLKAA